MKKAKAPMPGKMLCTRLKVEHKATLILERMADLEGRDKQRNLGIVLERIADIFENAPLKLVELGIITNHVAKVA